MPRKTYRRSAPKRVTWVTLAISKSLSDASPNCGIIGDYPNFMVDDGNGHTIFSRPVLFRGGYLTGSGRIDKTGTGSAAAYAGVGFTNVGSTALIENSPESFPLIAPFIRVGDLSSSSSSTLHFRLDARTKSMRKLARGLVGYCAYTAVGPSVSGSNVGFDALARMLFEVD